MKILLISVIFLFFSFTSVHSQPYFPDAGTVYQTGILPRIDITISEDTLQWLYDNVESDKEFKALFVFSANGVSDTVTDIGFRLRGASSRYSAKKSFKISFNTYAPGGKFHGLEKMNLNGEHNDPSVMRTQLTWDLFRAMKVPASRSNHADVYINGRYYGLYQNVEHVDEQFIQSRFGNDLGNLFKCLYPASLVYLGTNKDDYKNNNYTLKTNTQQDDYTDLIQLTQTLKNTTPDQFPTIIEPIFDINSFLRYLAVEVFVGHWDGYSFNKNNYYLFDNLYTGKIEFIPYDVDNTFGVEWSGIDWANRDIYNWWNSTDSIPLTSKIFQNQVYKDRFSFFIHQLVTQYADTTDFFPKIDAYKSKIDASAAADDYRPLDYGWSYDDYNGSYTEALGAPVTYGLKPFITSRINSINAQLVLNPIAPIVENVYHSFPQPGQDISVHLNITDDEPNPTGKLYYNVDGGAFNMLTLTHDSAQSFSAVIPGVAEASEIKFYIEATDASANISREPYSGEYSIKFAQTNPSLMITEFMASNSNTIVDNYGANEDWIEIENTGDSSIYLGDKYLTDDLAKPNKFNLPDISLEPGQYYLVWADDDKEQGVNHANFKLSASGESIGLFNSFTTGYTPIQTLDFPAQTTDMSSGIDTTGAITTQDFITPGGENDNPDVSFITFRFNMNKQIRDGNFTPSNDFIDVAGTFNDWAGADRIFDGNEDGIYQYTDFGFTSGENIEFKARINSDWGTAEFPELGGAGNRLYTVEPGHNILEFWYNDDEDATPTSLEVPELSMNLFPNPAPSGKFTVASDFAIQSVSVYSITGRLIFQKEVDGSTSIQINTVLQKGIYVVKISGQDTESICKLMVY